MGRKYTVSFSAVAVTATQDLFEYVAPATGIARILGWELSQTTEVGDAAEEGLLVTAKSGMTSSGSGGSSATPAKLQEGDAAAAGSAEINNTTPSASGTIVTHYVQAWNIRGPLTPPPHFEPIVLAPSRRFALNLGTNPADSITMSGTLIVEEEG